MDGYLRESEERPSRFLGVTLAQLIGARLWDALLQEGQPRTHRPGEVLLRQGDSGTHVLGITAGSVKVERRERDGRVRVLAFRGAGDVVGEAAVIDENEVRLASVESISVCRVVVVTKPRFTRFVDRHRLFPVLHRHALTRLRESDRARTCYGGSPERLAEALLALAAAEGTGALELLVTRAELAQYLGISRNTVSALLQEIGTRVVSAERKSILVHDPGALRALAGAGGPRP